MVSSSTILIPVDIIPTSISNVGDIVKEGRLLGHGGNSGANARRSGHGGHLHLEIFDAKLDSALTATEILKSLKF
jgi:hypothetical protein